MKGFFSTSTLTQTKPPISRIPLCGSCGLHKTCHSPKMKWSGKGQKKILIVAEAPGKTEDLRNISFVGDDGQLLRKKVAELGFDLDQDCWKTNAVICRPPKNKTPTTEQISACVPNLFKTIKELKPIVIVLLGGVSVQSLIGTLRNEHIKTRETLMGWQIPCQQLNTWICPTYLPDYLLRAQNSLLERILKNNLKNAFAKANNRPWETVPDFKNDVELITKPSRAVPILKEIEKEQGTIAFDYETNCLKPEYPGSEIYSCSVCSNGKQTISFPWAGEAIDAMTSLLKSPIKKIASNLKFEDRWTMNKLRIRIKHWLWDTMIAAHTLNNCPGITGLKFQSFVLLGQSNYNDHISPFLEAEDPTTHLNKIHKIDTHDLLLYNGLDSLLEYKVAQIQMKQFKKEY